VADIAHLVRRITELEKLLDALFKERGIVAWLNDRLEAIEQRPVVRYCGVFDPTRQYVPGNLITSSGSVWHCDSACTGTRPPGPPWTLAVKHGKDGKDAKPAQRSEPVVR
jgi:hypothetical protein